MDISYNPLFTYDKGNLRANNAYKGSLINL